MSLFKKRLADEERSDSGDRASLAQSIASPIFGKKNNRADRDDDDSDSSLPEFEIDIRLDQDLSDYNEASRRQRREEEALDFDLTQPEASRALDLAPKRPG